MHRYMQTTQRTSPVLDERAALIGANLGGLQTLLQGPVSEIAVFTVTMQEPGRAVEPIRTGIVESPHDI